MKILSINIHSLIEPDCETKLEQFADMIGKERLDIIGLQEVNQTKEAPLLEGKISEGYVSLGKEAEQILFRQDNYAVQLARALNKRGIPFFWTWLPVKLGYGKYDEGLAIFSRTPIMETDQFLISRSRDYQNWKTRKILGMKTQLPGQEPEWFYTVHMGWWGDEEEGFQNQWDCIQARIKKKREEQRIWLMGDFNSQDNVRDQGYDYVARCGWHDTYVLAQEKDEGITVETVIDGWRDQENIKKAAPGMRIDYIWCSHQVPISSSMVMCNGRRYPKVSDHNGVMILTGA